MPFGDRYDYRDAILGPESDMAESMAPLPDLTFLPSSSPLPGMPTQYVPPPDPTPSVGAAAGGSLFDRYVTDPYVREPLGRKIDAAIKPYVRDVLGPEPGSRAARVDRDVNSFHRSPAALRGTRTGGSVEREAEAMQFRSTAPTGTPAGQPAPQPRPLPYDYGRDPAGRPSSSQYPAAQGGQGEGAGTGAPNSTSPPSPSGAAQPSTAPAPLTPGAPSTYVQGGPPAPTPPPAPVAPTAPPTTGAEMAAGSGEAGGGAAASTGAAGAAGAGVGAAVASVGAARSARQNDALAQSTQRYPQLEEAAMSNPYAYAAQQDADTQYAQALGGPLRGASQAGASSLYSSLSRFL